MKNIKKIILINLAIFAAGAAILDVVWRISYANDIRFSVNVLAGTQYNYAVSALYDSDNDIIFYSRDEFGFRGKYRKVEDIDIIAVGGSTTDQRYLDDKKEWVYVLANHPILQGLDITVVNAGVDGQSSFGHIKNFDLWFSKIDSLQPKYILFYIGLNDFYKDDGYSFDRYKVDQTSSLTKFIKGSFFYYIYRLIKGITETKVYDIGHKVTQIDSLKKTTTPLLKEKQYRVLMNARLDAYFSRLEMLAKKTKEMGAIPVFVTQRRINHWIENNQIIGVDEEHSYGNVKYNGVDMHFMEKLLNDTTLSICKQHSDSICIDLASDIEFEKNDFYDSAHNTPSGSAKIGHYLAKKIKLFYQE